MKTSENILQQKLHLGELAVFFIGQAGFVFKTPDNTLIAIDLYLSDCCERIFGFKRLIPKLIAPDELVFDAVITTHAHYDHFDIDAMPGLMSHPKTVLYTSLEGVKESEKLPISPDRVKLLSTGTVCDINDLRIKAVYCDHGEMAPDAVGILLSYGDKSVYITGDTSYKPDEILKYVPQSIDIMIVPINGAFGNMNEHEAVLLTKALSPKVVIPCHYGNFAEHGGDPKLFIKNLTNLLPHQKYATMSLGDLLVI